MSRIILQMPALRALEAENAAAAPSLMERAGASAARIALEMLAGTTRPPLILAGPGNNGGDAFVVARLLKEHGCAPRVLFAGDPTRLPDDARRARAAWLAAGGTCQNDFPEEPPGLTVDGLFGIGVSRPIEGPHADWITRANAGSAPILALDVPSGLDAMTGRISGPTIAADRTATFIALKPGLLTGDGPDLCGDIIVCDLDLDIRQQAEDGAEIGTDLLRPSLRARRRNSHKGSFGSVAILGGAPGMAGAALLAGRAALKLGSGRVYLGMLERLPVDAGQPELMLRAPEDALRHASVLAIGPGLGQSVPSAELLAQALDAALPLVIDADALNLLTQGPLLVRKIAERPAPTFITPHPAEAARLLGCATAEIENDRLAAARELVRRFRAHVALKGCGTIVVAPDQSWFINASGNPGLASAGSGDVLTGMLAALLAQGWPPREALLGAVHLHGAAADACVAAGHGPVGLTAGELLDPARALLNGWIADLDR